MEAHLLLPQDYFCSTHMLLSEFIDSASQTKVHFSTNSQKEKPEFREFVGEQNDKSHLAQGLC